jgi:tRNA(Arg) A34 adenosine deaminase TadA
MTHDQMLAHLRAANEVAREAAVHGHHPFGCVLVDSDDRILTCKRRQLVTLSKSHI